MSVAITITTIEGEAVRGLGAELLTLCDTIFPGFAPDYLTGRLGHVDAPAAVVARDGGGRLVGFKLGYRRGAGLFYSWLGGIHPTSGARGWRGG